MLGEGEEGSCLFPSLRFDLPLETFPLPIPMDAFPTLRLPHLPPPLASISSTLGQGTTVSCVLQASDNMKLSPRVMIQRLLPILANLPCAVTLLDLDAGPVYQNGPSLRSETEKCQC